MAMWQILTGNWFPHSCTRWLIKFLINNYNFSIRIYCTYSTVQTSLTVDGPSMNATPTKCGFVMFNWPVPYAQSTIKQIDQSPPSDLRGARGVPHTAARLCGLCLSWDGPQPHTPAPSPSLTCVLAMAACAALLAACCNMALAACSSTGCMQRGSERWRVAPPRYWDPHIVGHGAPPPFTRPPPYPPLEAPAECAGAPPPAPLSHRRGAR